MNKTWIKRLAAWIMICAVLLCNTGYWVPLTYAEEGESTPSGTYTIYVAGGTGAFYYQAGETYLPIEDGSVTLSAGTYQIRYVGGQGQLVAVSGAEGEQAVTSSVSLLYDADAHTWEQQWDGSLQLQTDVTLTASEAALSLCLENPVNALLPDTTYQMGLCAASGESIYDLDQVPEYTFRMKEGTASDVELTSTGKNQAELVYRADQEPVADMLEVEAVDAAVTGEASQTEAACSGQFAVSHAVLEYGTDYVCTADTGMYVDVRGTRPVIYHNGTKKTVKLLKGRYTAFRYRDQASAYPASYTTFGTFASSYEVQLGQGAFFLQMKNMTVGSEKFGSTGEIRVVEDQEAPTLAVYKNGVQTASAAGQPILLKADDILTVGAGEDPDGSGIDRITRVVAGREQTVQSAQTMQYQLQTAAIACVEGSQSFLYRVYDHVGNMQQLEFTVNVDTVLPEITVDTVEAVVYAGEDVYYINTSDATAVSVVFEDIHLDADTVHVTGPLQMTGTAVRTEDSYQMDCVITGSGTVQLQVQDTHGNQAWKQLQVVLDTTMPQVVDGSVRLRDADAQMTGTVYTPYGTMYQAEGFHEPLLDFQVQEQHLLKIEIAAEHQDQTVVLQPNTPQGDTYTYQDVSLGELDAFAGERLHIYVYDKAGNVTDYVYQNGFQNRVTYAKSAVQLSATGVTNALRSLHNKQFIVPDQGKLHIQTTASGELLVPELLWVQLCQVDAQGNVSRVAAEYRYGDAQGLKVTNQGESWYISCDYALQAEDTDAYRIQVSYMDIAQKQVITLASDIYYIDQEPVQLTAVSSQVASGGRTGQDVRVIYTMHEVNPDFSAFVYTYTSRLHTSAQNPVVVGLVKPDGTSEQVPITELTTRICDESVWKQEDAVYTLTLEYTEQSIYTTALTVQDVMGTTATALYDFRVDKEAPQLLSVNVKSAYENFSYTKFNRFDTASAVITVSIRDAVSDASEISVICTAKDEITQKEQQLQGVLEQNQDGNYTYLMTLKKNFKGTLTFTISDGFSGTVAEHVKYADGVIVEDAAMHKKTSAVEITASRANAYGFYRTDAVLKLSAADSYSGIRTIDYSVNGKHTSLSFEKETELRTTWEKTDIVLKAGKENEGNEVPVVLDMEDNAGNQSTLTRTYKVDITKPVIRVTFDRSQALHDKYYQDNRTATITIRELNYNAASTVVTVYRDGSAVSVTPHFRSDGSVQTMEDGTQYKEYQMQLPFTEDGAYTFAVQTTDLAGNQTKYTYQDAFVIDHTLPELSLTFDRQKPYKEQYYGEGRTATLTVREHNFNAADIAVSVTASHLGTSIAAPQVGAFTSVGDVHTAQIVFDREGDYTISVQGKDLAGNQAVEIAEQAFTIDLSAPEIEITGVEQNTSYNRVVQPVVHIRDGNYDADGIQITITGGRHGTLAGITPQVVSSEREYIYTYPDLRYLRDYDDCYTIQVSATDRAGHTTTASRDYHVNRFGSTYTYSAALQQVLEQYYGTASGTYSIIETNVDPLAEYQLAYTLDGEIVNLKEGTDYTVVTSRTEDHWYRYEYQLSGELFRQEGNYALSVTSTDKAGNITDNKAQHAVMEFCIDNTAPSCIISGVSEGQRFEQDAVMQVGVEIYDNTRLQSAEVILNGEQIATLDDFEDGKLTEIAIDRSVRHQSLQVISRDAAGNERNETVTFTCLQNMDQIASVVWMVLAAGAVCAAGVCILRIRRRKSQA